MKIKISILAIALVLALTAMATPALAVASASRELPSTPVNKGANFDVRISGISGYGTMGQIIETLPDGFSYVSSTLDSQQVSVSGNTVNFTLIGTVTEFTYTVAASNTAGTYSFSGLIKDENKIPTTITGDTQVVVSTTEPTPTTPTPTTPTPTTPTPTTPTPTTPTPTTPVPTATTPTPGVASASRDLPASVDPGMNFNVNISVSNYGSMGQVIETLPNGFSYVSSTLDPQQVSVSGNTVNFTLIGAISGFTYTVAAPNTTGTYSFSGILKDENKTQIAISGDTQAVVSEEVQLLLKPGWNYFSVPFELKDSSVTVALSGVPYDTLFTWDTTSEAWKPTTTLDPLRGYIIHVNASTEQQITLNRMIPAAPSSIDLKLGFNLIGFVGDTSLPAQQALAQINDSYQFIFEWNGASFTVGYNGDLPGTISTADFEIRPMHAYWILMNEDKTFRWIG